MGLVKRRGLRLVVVGALALGLAGAGACTVFNGVTAATCSTSSTGYLTLDQAAHACAYIMTCEATGQFELDIESSLGVVTSHTSFAYCVNALAGSVPATRPGENVDSTALLCIANAPTCAAARACVGVETIDDPSTDPRCTNIPDSGIYCADNDAAIVDCTLTGGYVTHCNEPPFTQGSCVIVPDSGGYYFCGDDNGGYAGCTACDISSSLLTTCLPDSGYEGYVLCASLGDTCGSAVIPTDAGDGGPIAASPVCFANGTYAACNATTFSDECVDGAVTTCNYYGTESPTDCNALGDKCVQGNQPFCIPSNATCTPFTPGIGGCEDDVVSLCIDGKPFSYDCRCAGMVCKTSTANGQQGGACVVP
jgi:hypothetical protein